VAWIASIASMSCPFAGMTRIRFKGFFSAQLAHWAPLGTAVM
jgi:hypothetical protein